MDQAIKDQPAATDSDEQKQDLLTISKIFGINMATCFTVLV